jgi:hypothetical protein
MILCKLGLHRYGPMRNENGEVFRDCRRCGRERRFRRNSEIHGARYYEGRDIAPGGGPKHPLGGT